MIYICDAYGNAVRCIPQRVVQGSAEGCVLTVAAPVSENAQFSVRYRLPSGVGTEERYLTCIGLLEGLQGEGGLPLYGWRDTVPAAVTAHYGTVSAQFSFMTADGSVQAGAPVLFTVERGVAGPLPPLPDEGIYAQILAALAQLGADLIAARYAARALYAYNEEFVYAAGEIVYCPDAYEHGTFVRSLASDNKTAPYTEEGTLNAEAWEEVCRFDDVYDQAQTARQMAQIAASEADAAQVSAAASEACAVRAEEAAGKAEAWGEEVRLNAESAKASAEKAGLSAEVAAQEADRARKFAESATHITYDYKSYESLPRPGSSRFIYMVPSANGKTGNAYDEYVWSDEQEEYEKIGASLSPEDLSGYATKTYANTLVYASSPLSAEGQPVVGSAFQAPVSSFSRTPAAGDHFTVFFKDAQTGELSYVCAKVSGISASEATAVVLSVFSPARAERAEISLTEEEYEQYAACNGKDTVITLGSEAEEGKSFALLDLAGNGTLLLTACGDGYALSMPYGDGGLVCLQAKGNSLSVRFLFGLPGPAAGDVGKVPTVNAAGDGYELKLSQGAGSNIVELGEVEMVSDYSFEGTASDENYEKLSLPNTVVKLTLPYGLGDLYGLVSPVSGGYYAVAVTQETEIVYAFTISVYSDKSIRCNMVDISPVNLRYVSGAGSDDRWQEAEASNDNRIFVRRELPKPTASDAGKVAVVNEAGDGFELHPYRRRFIFTPGQGSAVTGPYTKVKPYMRPLSEDDAYATSDDDFIDPGMETISDTVPFYVWGAGYKVGSEDTVVLGNTTYDQAVRVDFPPNTEIWLIRKFDN